MSNDFPFLNFKSRLSTAFSTAQERTIGLPHNCSNSSSKILYKFALFRLYIQALVT